MMPKSTATSRPCASTNRLPGCMSAWKKPSRSAWRRKDWMTRAAERDAIVAGGARARRGRDSGMPSIHSLVSTSRAVRSQSGLRHAEIGIVLACSRRVPTAAAASSRRSISIGDRARERLHDLDGRRRRASRHAALERARAANRMRRDRGRSAARTPGRSTFTATRRVAIGVADARAVHLRDRGGRDRLAEFREQVVERPAERAPRPCATASWRGKGGMRSCSAFEVARDRACRRCRAASPGTGRT